MRFYVRLDITGAAGNCGLFRRIPRHLAIVAGHLHRDRDWVDPRSLHHEPVRRELIGAFGWSKAAVRAGVGSLPMFTLLRVPFAGRFADRFGARIAATLGFIAMSLGVFAFSTMSSNIVEFFSRGDA